MNRALWLLVVATVIVLTKAAHTKKTAKCTERNTSESGKQASDDILKCIDKSIDPCDDFYNFACGGYIKSNEIPSDSPWITQFTTMHKLVLEQLRTLIQEPIKDDEPRWSKLAKKMYQVCHDTDAIEKKGLTYVKTLLKQIGGWPVVEGRNWNADHFQWEKLMYKFRQEGLPNNYLFLIAVQAWAANTSQRVIVIAQPDPPLNLATLKLGFEDKTVKSYYKYLVDLAVLFGATKDDALADFESVFDFMKELAQIVIPPEELRDLTAMTNIMTVEELQKKFPYINWTEYINSILRIPNVKITKKDSVNVGMPKYISRLGSLLNKTSKRVLANYFISLAVTSLTDALSKDVRDIRYEFNKAAMGVSSVTPRWKECVEMIMQNFEIASAALYARKYFTAEAKSGVTKLVSNLHGKFLEMLRNVEWMDDATKKEAMEKAVDIQEHIAYPEELLDDDMLNEFYKDLKASNDYLQYILNVAKFLNDKMSETLFQAVNRSDWKEHSASHKVNAFYHLTENSIIVPAAILQGVVFKNDRPKFMNYAGIGFLVGHELTHGFDDMGNQISKNRKLENWWSPATEKAYAAKAKCIIDQYSSFKFEKLNLHLNGILTLGENIADNGALKLAYEAYEKDVQANGAEKCLPNLEYTPKQLFWISLANAWCEKTSDEYLKLRIKTDSHAPAMCRVNGIVANSKDFVKDFNCPVNSKMNPNKKCTFW